MRFAVLTLAFALSASAAEIPQGSHALLRMVNSISTRTAREGDYVYFRTATPIAANNAIVVPAESYVQGVVTHSVRSGRVKGRAELAIRIESLTLPSGKVVKLSPTLASIDSGEGDQKVVGKENEIKQGTSHGQDAVKITGASAMGAAIGAMADRSWQGSGMGAGAGAVAGLATVLLTRGREVELRQGSTIDVIFERAVPMD